MRECSLDAIQVLWSRLEGIKPQVFNADAITFCSKKVHSVSGDARKAFQICRWLPLRSREPLRALLSLSPTPPDGCRPAGRCAAEMAATEGAPCVTIKIAQQAAQQTFSSFDANAVHMYLARWPALRRSLLLRSAALFSFPLCPVPFGTFADS